MKSLSKAELEQLIAGFGAANFVISEMKEVINDLENEIADLEATVDRLEDELATEQAKGQELNEFIEEIPPIAYSQRRYY